MYFPVNFAKFLKTPYFYKTPPVAAFDANLPFLHPLKHSTYGGFLTFSGGIEMEHWYEMG